MLFVVVCKLFIILGENVEFDQWKQQTANGYAEKNLNAETTWLSSGMDFKFS